MEFKRNGEKVRIKIIPGEFEDKYVPSVNIMLKSAASIYHERVLGIVLTGMGNDGCQGMVRLKDAGCYTIAESEETAVVYGMPQEVVKADAASYILALDKIPSKVRRLIMGERRT